MKYKIMELASEISYVADKVEQQIMDCELSDDKLEELVDILERTKDSLEEAEMLMDLTF